MPQKQDHEAAARQSLDLATGAPDPAAAALQAQVALTHAVLAVAGQLTAIREQLVEVADNLEDQDGYGAGAHLRNVSDWLEKIAGRPR